MNYKKYLLFLNHKTRGQLLIEILVAIALSSILLPALLTGIVSSRSGKAQQGQRAQAVALMKETEESIRSIRERKWDNFATNGTYHPSVTGTEWTLAPGIESISGFTRSITISDTHRDANGVVVTPPSGTPDPSTKKIDITISWTTPYSSSVTSVMYITRFTNTTTLQTTQADFDAGILNDTFVTNTEGGEVILGAGGGGDWCKPNESIVTRLDLPKNGVANAISGYEGRIIAGTGENAAGVSLADISVNNSNPPIATISGTFDGYKTNGVYLEGNYAYIATDNNSKEVVIIDMTTHQEVGHFDTPSSADATSVYVLNNKGYVTAGFYLYIFDLSQKTGGRPQLGQYFFLGTATSVAVNGNYAFVSLASSFIEMQIIDISNPGSLSIVGWANVNGTDGKRIFVNQTGTRAYLATNADPSHNELFIIDITSKSGSRPIVGSYDASGMNPKNLAIVPGNKAILVGTGGEEYQVIDISNDTNPVRCGGMQVAAGINDIAGILEADGDAYSYIITGDASNELQIIVGGAGGQFSSSGTFLSKIFDATSSAAFNRIIPVFTQPNQTTVRLQVAVAAPVNSSCSGATFSFVGPDGTAGTYFTGEGLVPLITVGAYQNPERCFRYKVFLNTTDISQTPVFKSMLINYSP